ncbi:hypothetical protein PRK78_002963 [Emydomyces testavorans]|uniref:Uncharacterized protein n=1 Tax=Emydomyces testavorans TaxID=2070801 RepID=A0AAF0DF87_9EURO|nr:hypothetical protein PRK78_002963 [Emydomyces testavorans]
MPTPTAPLLALYTSPPSRYSLYLITSLLGTTGNWLVLKFLCDALYPSFSASSRGRWPQGAGVEIGMKDKGRPEGGRRGAMRVVLVSFLRGWEFWRGEARRLGIDLTKLTTERKFVFVDGLTGLFSHEYSHSTSAPATLSGRPPTHASRLIPITQHHQATHSVPLRQKSSGPTKLHWSKTGKLETIERDIVSAIDVLNSSTNEEDRVPTTEDVLLVIDQPDLLLAAAGLEGGIGALEHVHSTVVQLAADSPLIHYEEPGTPLEMEHANLAVGMAYQARVVMQLRGLETGAARDVSGVLQINRGTPFIDPSDPGHPEDDDLEPKEVLYHVQGDGAVRVFGRGE